MSILELKVEDLKEKLRVKKESLRLLDEVQIEQEDVDKLYEEVSLFFPGRLTYRLAEANEFHRQLTEDRKNRLMGECEEIELFLLLG